MSETTARPVPGTVPRNGMPPAGGYVYRGLGYDQLAPSLSRAAQRRSATVRRKAAEGPAPYGAPAELARQQVALRLCPACDADRCEACYGDGCACACNDWPPAAAPAPAPGPARCGGCGYLKTAPGHKIACEPGDAARVEALGIEVPARELDLASRIHRLAESVGAAS